MLSQTYEDKQLINVTAARPKANGPFRSNLEAQPELKKKQEKLHLQWPPIKENQCVVDRTLGPYQHGQQPKAGSSSSQWPPPTVQNPWDKEVSPRTFPPPIRSLPPYWSAGNSMKTHLSCWNLQPPQPLIKSQTQRLPSVLPGWKPLQPDLLTLLPYPLRPWKLYITSSRKSSFSYVPLLPRTLSRMTFLSWMTSYSELTLLSWRLNSCPMTRVWLPLNCTHTLAYASKAHHIGVSRSRPASTG